MRRMIGTIATGLLLSVALVAPAQGGRQPPEHGYAFFTPPIEFINNTFEVSFVNTGTAPVELTIQLCTLLGVCNFPPGSACVTVPLTRGEGCSTANIAD